MHYSSGQIEIEQGDELCVIRIPCTNESILKLVEVFKKPCWNDTHKNVFYSFTGFEYYVNNGNKRSLETIYNENILSDTHFLANKGYIVSSTYESFESTNPLKRMIIVELIYIANEDSANDFYSFCDPISFIYIRILHALLSKKGYEHAFMISSINDKACYEVIPDREYFKIRSFLCLSPDNLNNCIRVFRSDIRKWSRLFTNTTVGHVQDIGRISPLFDINEKSPYELQASFIELDKEGTMYTVVQKYIDDLRKLITKYDINIDLNTYEKSDAVIDLLLFSCTVIYIVKGLEEEIYESKTSIVCNLLKTYDFSILHERCVDYAQGIIQLIENAYYHALSCSEDSLGFWCIRIREKQNTVSIKNRHIERNRNVELNGYNRYTEPFFMEVFIMDYILNGEADKGIVKKFYENIQSRLKNVNDLSKDEQDCLNEVLKSRNSSTPILLQHMFGVDWEKSALKKYLEFPENVAWHYGLQILDNVVLSGNGCLYVKSGLEHYMTYEQSAYNRLKLPWTNGTAYAIVLPIQIQEEKSISYLDRIDRVDEGTHEHVSPFLECNYYEYFKEICKNEYTDTPFEKNRIVTSLVNVIREEDSIKKNIFIDCSGIKSIYSWEILAKTIFLCFSKAIVENVGLINFHTSRDVIKLFRQFALFYDRFGNNSIMNNKSVFMADVDARIDILLLGPISSIKHNLHNNQICGGVNEEIMRIVSYLGNRGGQRDV